MAALGARFGSGEPKEPAEGVGLWNRRSEIRILSGALLRNGYSKPMYGWLRHEGPAPGGNGSRRPWRDRASVRGLAALSPRARLRWASGSLRDYVVPAGDRFALE